jgi:hypothetical protein
MQRRQFLQNAGLAGLCSCVVARAFASDPTTPAKPAPEKDWRMEFAKQRYSKLLSVVATQVNEKTFREIVEEVGRFCAESGFSKNYVGQLEAYLAEMERRWGSKTAYDAEHGLVPGAACQCSVGSMRRSFANVTGQEVTVKLKESALQGGQRCSFEVQLGPA